MHMKIVCQVFLGYGDIIYNAVLYLFTHSDVANCVEKSIPRKLQY